MVEVFSKIKWGQAKKKKIKVGKIEKAMGAGRAKRG
jgi:hypothetical protein